MIVTADDDDDCWQWVLIDGTHLLMMMMITVDGVDDDGDGVSTKDEINVPITLSVFRDKEWWVLMMMMTVDDGVDDDDDDDDGDGVNDDDDCWWWW